MKELTEGLNMDEARQATEWMSAYQAGSIVLGFEIERLENLKHVEAHVAHAMDASNAAAPKLVFHFKNVSRNEMERLGQAMFEKVAAAVHTIPGNIHMSASESPIFRGQWDLLIYNVPIVRVREIHRLVLTTAKAI